jgi:hypothetical protein
MRDVGYRCAHSSELLLSRDMSRAIPILTSASDSFGTAIVTAHE